MIRMTVTLIVAIYVVLIVVPPADHGENVTVTRAEGQNWLVAIITDAEAGAQRPPRDRPAVSYRTHRSSLTDNLLETEDGYALQTARGEQLAIAAVINPVDLLPRDETAAAIGSVSVAVAADPAVAQPAEGTGQIWRVVASAVNFREGPSTNTNVLTALSRGEEVEFLASAADDWARLRVVSTGLEGYMASQFLEPVN